MSFFESLPRTFIIAEIGVNHDGSVNKAKELIEAAKVCGADAVKFQTFEAGKLALPSTKKVNYQKITTPKLESHFKMLERLELSRSDHELLFKFCSDLEIEFLSTPYDVESAKFLFGLGVRLFKTASADLTDYLLHQYLASTHKPVLIATGMSEINDIRETLSLYNHKDLLLLHCVSNYPCSYDSINMKALSLLGDELKLSVGYSDHSLGSLAAVVAVSMGARVIEKHFTLNKLDAGPDHSASSTPEEFLDLVTNIRLAEKILGRKIKSIQNEELNMSQISKKSIYNARDIHPGHIAKLEDFVLMRPGDGLHPKNLNLLIGKQAIKYLPRHSKVFLNDFE